MARPRSTTLPVLALLLALALALTATACGGSSNSSNPNGTAQGTPKHGGHLEMVMASDMRAMDPFGALSNSYNDNTRLNAVYDSLFWHEARTGKVMPQIGESLTPDASNTVWTVKIRPNVRFSDGTPYDAAAVKWTWDQHANPERRSVEAASAEAIATTQVLDPTTLKVTLKAPNANFDHVVASSLSFIGSPTAYQKNPAAFSRAPVGAGPFLLKEWQPGDHQTFVKNPHYWQGPDKPALDTFTVRVIADGDQAMNTISSGGADLKVSVNPQDPTRAHNHGLGAETVTVYGGESVFFNTTRPPFDDVRARRAVALALDAKDLNQVSFAGEGAPAQSIFPPDSPLVDPGTTTVPATDRAQAQHLLDELAAAGKRVDFTFSYPQSSGSAKTAEYLQSRLQSLRNISVTLHPVQIAAYQTQIQVNHDYQASMYSWYLSDPEPGLYMYLNGSSPNNVFGYHNQAVDDLLQRGRSTQDPTQRRAAYTALARTLQQDLPLWTYQSSVITAYHRNTVTGIVLSNDGMLLMDRIGLT